MLWVTVLMCRQWSETGCCPDGESRHTTCSCSARVHSMRATKTESYPLTSFSFDFSCSRLLVPPANERTEFKRMIYTANNVAPNCITIRFLLDTDYICWVYAIILTRFKYWHFSLYRFSCSAIYLFLCYRDYHFSRAILNPTTWEWRRRH